MTKFILIIILFLPVLGFTQDVVYKRNAFGQVEIYSSNYGVPVGTPIGVVRRTAMGYIEVKDMSQQNAFRQSENAYSRRPQLITTKPYLAPVSQHINSLNTFIEANKIQSQAQSQNEVTQRETHLKNLFEEMQTRYTDLLSFYNQIQNKPKSVSDGWHNVTCIMPNPLKDVFKGDKLVKIGYANVINNKVKQVIYRDFTQGIMFEKEEVISNAIDGCKAFTKEPGSNSNLDEIYFLDYLLDTTTHADLPKIGIITFGLDPRINRAGVVIYRKDPRIYGDGYDNSLGQVYILRDVDGNIKPINYFCSYVGTYYYKAGDLNNHVWVDAFNLTENDAKLVNLTY